jgi:hypothetical protein
MNSTVPLGYKDSLNLSTGPADTTSLLSGNSCQIVDPVSRVHGEHQARFDTSRLGSTFRRKRLTLL